MTWFCPCLQSLNAFTSGIVQGFRVHVLYTQASLPTLVLQNSRLLGTQSTQALSPELEPRARQARSKAWGPWVSPWASWSMEAWKVLITGCSLVLGGVSGGQELWPVGPRLGRGATQVTVGAVSGGSGLVVSRLSPKAPAASDSCETTPLGTLSTPGD